MNSGSLLVTVKRIQRRIIEVSSKHAFTYGFAKSDWANIDDDEEKQFTEAARHVLQLTEKQIEGLVLVKNGEFRPSSQIWAELHEKAFRQLTGVTRVVVLDNHSNHRVLKTLWRPDRRSTQPSFYSARYYASKSASPDSLCPILCPQRLKTDRNASQ